MVTLKKFEFPDPTNRSIYDWDKILSGAILQLDEGKDYKCKTSTFVYLARQQAKKQNKTLRAKAVEGGVVVQAVASAEAATE
jgi:hypothetical protein